MKKKMMVKNANFYRFPTHLTYYAFLEVLLLQSGASLVPVVGGKEEQGCGL